MMLIPFVGFWILVYIGRDELGLKGAVLCIALWIGLFVGSMKLSLPSYYFTAAQALLDAILIIVIVGGDIRIR